MTNTREEIKKKTNTLAEIELHCGSGRWSTINYEKKVITNLQHKCLDNLARLLTGKGDICVAVFYDGKKILVANNFRKAIYAETCLDIISELAWGRDKNENYEKLFELAIIKIYDSIYRNSAKGKSEKAKKKETIKDDGKDYKDFEELIEAYKNDYLQYVKNKEEIIPGRSEKQKEILDFARQLFKKIKESDLEKNKGAKYEKYLMPLHDTTLIINDISENADNKEAVKEIVRAIKEKAFEFIAGEVCEKITCDSCKNDRRENCECLRLRDYGKLCVDYGEENGCGVCQENSVHAEWK